MIKNSADTNAKDSMKKDDNSNTIKSLFIKEISCPVCKNSFGTASVKVNAPRIASRDSDLFIRYSVINPYLYEVWLCPTCGYAALKVDFSKIREFQIKLIKEKITPKWVNREYDIPFTEKVAIERYKLALLNALVIESKSSTKAMICLKIAWMYRLLMDEANEKNYIKQSLVAFNDTFMNEKLPAYGLDRFSIMFLIGELHRRIGEDSLALRWFSEVITSIGAPQKVKEMARDGKDKIRRY